MHYIGLQDTYTPAHTAQFEGIQRVKSARITRADKSTWPAGLLSFQTAEKGLVSQPPVVPFNPVCGPAGLGIPRRDVDSVL